MMDLDYIFTIEDVAKKFTVNPETVRRWCREGKIKFIKLPGKKSKYRFSETGIREFISNSNDNDLPVEEAVFGKNEGKPNEEK